MFVVKLFLLKSSELTAIKIGSNNAMLFPKLVMVYHNWQNCVLVLLLLYSWPGLLNICFDNLNVIVNISSQINECLSSYMY